MTEQKGSRWGLRGKTFWNWLELLIVPLALVSIGFLFTTQQDARQQQIENQRAQRLEKIENQRVEAERELAEQRAQDEALQAYFDQMSALILERGLLKANPGDPVHTLAQARTSTLMTRLDAERNRSVTRFLTDSQLTEGEDSLLSNIEVAGADLADTHLPEANLSNADVRGADLSSSWLANANLNTSYLVSTDLRWADLSNADLSNADLLGADLSYADLGGAEGITNEELEQQVKSLVGATMPNGQKYGEWLRDRKDSGDE